MRKTNYSYSQLTKLFEVMQYATHSPHCGGQLRVVGEVTEPKVIARILEHCRTRAPPCDALR